MIGFACLSCGLKLQVKEEFAGRKGSCPACKKPLEVPTLDKTVAHAPVAQLVTGQPSSLAHAGVDPGVTLGGKDDDGRPVREVLKVGSNGQRYVIESEIARGGMGVVLRAVDCDIRREVAVKYLLDQSDTRKKLRFVEEAQITGQLEHPNIVPIHELGVDGERRMFFSMKMVKGRSLEQILSLLRKGDKTTEKDYPLGRLLTILVGVCNALSYAHSRGVIHRDLKPANIMVGDFGEVYVMDWGLAKVLSAQSPSAPSEAPMAIPVASSSSMVATSREGEADLTQEGSVLGTPVYMAPEQATGRIHELDGRTDVYALGAILYELLTLLPPIDRSGGYLEILLRVNEGEIVPPEQRTPPRFQQGKIPPELSAIAMKALATDMARRYLTVEKYRQDLERFLEGRSVSARQDTFRESVWKLMKRNKGAALGAAAALLVLLVSLGFLLNAWIATGRANEAYRREQERTRQAVPSLVKAAQFSVERREYDDALAQLQVALDYQPNAAEARLLKAQVLIVRKEYAEAATELDVYLTLREKDTEARTLRNLCENPRPNEEGFYMELAQIFTRQQSSALMESVLREFGATSTEARKKLLAIYNDRLKAAWPGFGYSLGFQQEGML